MIFGIENFRVFRNYTEFDLRSLTVLTGTNNSGKSAVGKSLNLLHSGFKRKRNGLVDFSILHISEDLKQKIGGFDENLSRDSGVSQLKFNISVDNLHEERDDQIDYSYELTYGQSLDDKIKNQAVLKSVRIESHGRVIAEMRLTKVKDIDKDQTAVLKDLYSKYVRSQNAFREAFGAGATYGKSFEEYLKENEDNILFEPTVNEEIILNYLYFIDEFFGWEEHQLIQSSWTDDSEPRRAIFKGLQSKYTSIKSSPSFESAFGYAVLSNSQFFEKEENNGRSDYGNYALLKLQSIGIDNHKKFIRQYLQFEQDLIGIFLQDEFKPKLISENESIEKILFEENYSRPGKATELLSKIDNPLAQLFQLERLIHSYKTGKEVKVSHEIRFIADSILEEEWNFHFTNSILERGIGVEFWNLRLDSLYLPSVKILEQKQVVQEFYLENDKSANESPFFKFGQMTFKKEIDEPSKEFVDKWIQRMGLGDCLLVERIEAGKRTIGYSFYIQDGERKFPLVDNGFGINKIIMILLELATLGSAVSGLEPTEEKSVFNYRILLLEEPESNLHPSFQSMLAELLAEASQIFGVRLIVETHSEYFIRKLQYLVGSEGHFLKSEMLSMYYLHDPKRIPDGEKQVYQLDLREDGFMNNDFGKGFFDEASSLSLGLLNLKNFN